MVAILKMLNKFGIREIARTGKVSLTRESGVNTEYLKVSRDGARGALSNL